MMRDKDGLDLGWTKMASGCLSVERRANAKTAAAAWLLRASLEDGPRKLAVQCLTRSSLSLLRLMDFGSLGYFTFLLHLCSSMR